MAVSTALVLVAVPVTAWAGPARGPMVAQAGSRASAAPGDMQAARQATERARQRVDAAVRQRDAARADKAILAVAYEKQLAEIDRLKQGRASWRSDRLLRSRMSESLGTARKLAAIDERIRRINAQVRKHRRAFLQAIETELGLGVASARRAELVRWRAATRRGLAPGARKIVLPDDQLDPLADPEELEYQASLLRQSEDELTRELSRLDKQAVRYRHMAALQKKRNRATELSGFDDNQPRRSTGRAEQVRAGDAASDAASAEAGTAADSPAPSPPPSQIPGEGTPQTPDAPVDEPGGISDDPMFDVVLADVVDASTVSALRAAGVSTDPAVKARAAERARKQVKERLERLQKRRELMQKRARSLRRR